MNPDPTGDIAHLIQTALTPVFLLSGIGALLQVFNRRLDRVSDHMSHSADLLKNDTGTAEREMLKIHLARLSHRTWILNAAVALSAVGCASTCGAAFVIFLGSVRNSGVADWLIGLFGLALGCAVGSLVSFLIDCLLAWFGLRREGPLPRSVKDNGAQQR
jgi:formate hydrogenlyase subunit 3/multisubunit Na+/H+ antiporter MnhD subunit